MSTLPERVKFCSGFVRIAVVVCWGDSPLPRRVISREARPCGDSPLIGYL